MKKAIALTVLVFCFVQIYIRAGYVKYHESASGSEPDLFYLPSAKYIKPFVLGYDHLAADLIWLKTISYFSDQFLGYKQYPYLEKLLYIIVDLDPMFEMVYLWGGSVLMYNGTWITADTIGASNRFLKHGWGYIKNQKIKYRHHPEYWRIPHMIGFNYAIELRDREKGIPYIEEVARIEGAPSYYKTWAATLYDKEGKRDEAVKKLEQQLIVENLRTTLGQNIDKELKTQIMRRLKRYYNESYDSEYAEARIRQLTEETERLKRVYSLNYNYMQPELFLVMEGHKFIDAKKGNLVKYFHFER